MPGTDLCSNKCVAFLGDRAVTFSRSYREHHDKEPSMVSLQHRAILMPFICRYMKLSFDWGEEGVSVITTVDGALF